MVSERQQLRHNQPGRILFDGPDFEPKESETRNYRHLKSLGHRIAYLIPAVASFAPAAQSVPSNLYQLLNNREAIVRAVSLGTPIGLSALEIACGDKTPTSPTQPTPTPPSNQTPSGVEFNERIIDIDTGRPIPNGNLYVPMETNQLDVPFQNGNLEIKKEMGLQTNKSYQMTLNAPGYNPREFTGMVNPDGIKVDLMGGRMEYPLNMKNAGFDQNQYAYWRLRRDGHSQRPVKILTIAILDQFVYEASNGNLIKVSPYSFDKATLDRLLDVLANDAPIWTGGLYPQENVPPGGVPSYVRMQSRGDSVPDSRVWTDGWITIFPNSNIPDGYAIARQDSQTDNITDCFMALRPNAAIPRGSFSADLRECFGGVEHSFAGTNDSVSAGFDSSGRPLPGLRQYFGFGFARPPRHANPDIIMR